ncbi:glycosyltransferase family 2 protein [Variovorax sp. J2P1-59]|uniref:glycosyltransferase family 2 protein n=1 Tax=Variovorax flavidus TaxID=3053501 RepID=UPI002578695A|nr:glycosyltransferase family 2 protein [Variovorax sp. J2P1-59]MDM0075152.1 glycosyltransferase family 2 protein [Variovorax sp. J2P1-59]
MKIVVLMSTWQGERHVEEQIRSILAQLPPGGSILVRDDGSSDTTAQRIESFRDPRITLIRGPNLGFVRSFFALLDAAPDDADIVMLSDQDDVWLPNKIARAVAHLRPLGDQPALYCSRLRLVDEALEPLGLSPEWKRAPSFRNALTENIVTGCTCAINRAALPLAQQYGDPDAIYFHDWWLYLVIAAFGQVIVDREPTILYRQHGGNAIGMGSGANRYLAILRFLRRKNWVHIMFDQLDNFRVVHGARLSRKDQLLLARYFEPRQPAAIARLLLSPIRFRQSLIGDALLRLLVLGSLVSGRGLVAHSAKHT